MSKKGGFWDNPFGGMFDFNGDGKEDFGEQFIGFKIFEECTKEDNDNDDYSSDIDFGFSPTKDYSWRQYVEVDYLLGIFPENYETEEEYLEAFNEALENVMPVLEVKARRVGGSNYQVPMEVRPERRQTLGLRWIVAFSRTRSEKTMAERLANEIIDAKNSAGGAFKKKEETHRMAEANKAFAHFRY